MDTSSNACISTESRPTHWKAWVSLFPCLGLHLSNAQGPRTWIVLQTIELRSMRKWKSFVSRVNEMPEDEREEQHQKAHDFFDIAKQELLKMFDRWMDNRLFFLSSFGEAPTGSLVARYILSSEPITTDNATSLLRPREPVFYDSPMHGCKIDCREFCTYLVDFVGQDSLSLFKRSYHYDINRTHFEYIASGQNIWERNDPSSRDPRIEYPRPLWWLPIQYSNDGTRKQES